MDKQEKQSGIDTEFRIKYGLIGVQSAPKHKVVTEKQDKDNRDRHNAESDLQSKICKWLRKTYPGILFISDFAAGLYLTQFLANLRHNQSCEAKYLDLTILVPSPLFHGLIIEIKTLDNTPFLKDGITLAKDQHILSQYQTIQRLRRLGYASCFGVGEFHIKEIVVNYMRKNYINVAYIER